MRTGLFQVEGLPLTETEHSGTTNPATPGVLASGAELEELLRPRRGRERINKKRQAIQAESAMVSMKACRKIATSWKREMVQLLDFRV